MTREFAIYEARRRTNVLKRTHFVVHVVTSTDPDSAFIVVDRPIPGYEPVDVAVYGE